MHKCHARNCESIVPPEKFLCKRHWHMLPGLQRASVAATYRPGQEIDKRPSAAYVRVARRAIEWIAEAERVSA